MKVLDKNGTNEIVYFFNRTNERKRRPHFSPSRPTMDTTKVLQLWRRIEDAVQLEVGRENGHNGRTDLTTARQKTKDRLQRQTDERSKHKG